MDRKDTLASKLGLSQVTRPTPKQERDRILTASYDFQGGAQAGPEVKNEVKMEGMLYKKSSKILIGWQKRYFVLMEDRLLYYDKDKKTMQKGCLNFRNSKCSFEDKGGVEFTIVIEGAKKNLKLKALNEADARIWKITLQKTIESSHTINRATVVLDKTWKIDTLLFQDFQRIADYGDLLLLEKKDLTSKITRTVQNKQYDHVALVLRVGEERKILDFTNEFQIRFLDLAEYVRYNMDLYENFVLRRLVYDNKAGLEEATYQFIDKLFERVAAAQHRGERVELRSSEMIAAFLKSVGLLHTTRNSVDFHITDFLPNSKLKLQGNAFYSNEMQIIFDDPEGIKQRLLDSYFTDFDTSIFN